MDQGDNLAIKEDWRVEVIKTDDKGSSFFGGNTNKIKFSDTAFKLQGSEEYQFKFDEIKKEINGVTTLGVAGGSVLLFLIF